MLRHSFLIILFLTFSCVSKASDLLIENNGVIYSPRGDIYPVPDFRTHIPEARNKFQTYREIILNDPELSSTQKQQLIETKFSGIENEFSTLRKEQYKKFRFVEYCENSVTTSSGTKTTQPKCNKSPHPGLVTNIEMISTYKANNVNWDRLRKFSGGAWIYKAGYVSGNHNTIFCTPKLRRSSSGATRVITVANFMYTNDYISEKVKNDTAGFMSGVIN